MGSTKTESRLISELQAAHRVIEKVRLEGHGRLVQSRDFVHCFLQESTGKPYASDTGASAQFINRLRREGYLNYRSKRQGGDGWSVNPEYLVDEEKVKTVVIDQIANIKSKLDVTHGSPYDLLCNVAKISPSFTVGQLVEALKQDAWKAEEELLTKRAVASDDRLSIQQELEGIKLDYVRFPANNLASSGELHHVNLWQLYRIGQVIGTPAPAQSSQPEEAPIPKPPITFVVSAPGDEHNIDTDAPF